MIFLDLCHGTSLVSTKVKTSRGPSEKFGIPPGNFGTKLFLYRNLEQKAIKRPPKRRKGGIFPTTLGFYCCSPHCDYWCLFSFLLCVIEDQFLSKPRISHIFLGLFVLTLDYTQIHSIQLYTQSEIISQHVRSTADTPTISP
jgi:hypothetical protein